MTSRDSFKQQSANYDRPRTLGCPPPSVGTYPRVGLIITNITRPVERVIGFYNQRGTAEPWIKKGKKAVARPPEGIPAQSIIEKAPEHP